MKLCFKNPINEKFQINNLKFVLKDQNINK